MLCARGCESSDVGAAHLLLPVVCAREHVRTVCARVSSVRYHQPHTYLYRSCMRAHNAEKVLQAVYKKLAEQSYAHYAD